jgi:hypothetical protein
MSSELISKQINALIPNIKGGTLRFFGEWFGRPYDNYHRIIGSEFQDEILIIHFDKGESLKIREPEGFQIGENIFIIHKANCVRWEWFYYGRPRTLLCYPENFS